MGSVQEWWEPGSEPVPGTGAAPDGEPAPRRRRLRIDRGLAAASVALVLSATLLVVSVQRGLSERVLFDPDAISVADDGRTADPGGSAAVAVVDLPDARNLPLDEATELVSGAGVPAERIKVQEAPRAGPAGVVFDQQPAPGTNNPDEVTLFVSTEVAMADYVGREQAAVISQLESYGASPEVTFRFEPGKADGVVLSQSVAAGQPLPAELQLEVQGEGARVPLGRVDTVETDCSTSSDASVDTLTLPASVSCSLSTYSSSGPSTNEYVLSREFSALNVTLGVSNTSTPGIAVRFVVLLDGVPRADEVLQLGSPPKVLLIDTSGALRMTLQATFAAPLPDGTSPDVDAVFGSPTLITTPDVAKKYER